MDNYYNIHDMDEYSVDTLIKTEKEKEKEKEQTKKTNKVEAIVVYAFKNKTIIQIDDFGFVVKGKYDKEKVQVEYEGTIGKDFKIIKIK